MKQYFIEKDIRNIFRIVFVMLLATFISCSKDKETPTESGKTVVKINMGGSNFGTDVVKKGNIQQAELQTANLIIPLTHKFDIVATLSPENAAPANGSIISRKEGLLAATPVLTPLPIGTKYSIAAYNNAGAYVTHQNYTYSAGQVPELSLAAGDYQFIVVASGNNTLPTINFNQALSSINFDVQNADMDFMYFKQTMTVQSGQTNELNVVLKHLFTQVIMTLNTEAIGAVGSIGQATITPNYSVVSVSLSDGSLSYPPTSTASSKNLVFANSTGEVLVSNPVFIFPNGTSTGSITIANLQIGDITKPLTLSNLPLLDGVKYKLEFVIQAAGINIGNEIWSGGNLVYDPVDNRYGFTASDNDYGNYWFAGYTLPKLLDGTNQGPSTAINGASGDPCALVAPAGTWRLPTEAEATQLIDRTGPNGSDNPHNINAYDPARYVDTFDGGTSATNLGMFFGIQGNPGATRHDYLFCVYAGAYHNENTPGPTIGHEGNYLLSGTSGGYRELHLTGAAGDVGYGINIGQAEANTAYQIRCVKQ